MVIDSAVSSGPGGRPAAVTASSRTVGEDEDAGTGLSLVIDGVRHLQITTRPVPALKRPAQPARLTTLQQPWGKLRSASLGGGHHGRAALGPEKLNPGSKGRPWRPRPENRARAPELEARRASPGCRDRSFQDRRT